MSWEEQARCGSYDPDLFFDARAGNDRRARAICAGCTVRVECLADALKHRIEFGIWGGLTERERRRLLRQYPRESDWREVVRERLGISA